MITFDNVALQITALTMRRWISQIISGSLVEPFLYLPDFFFNAVCIVSDNLLIIESFGEMAYNISYLTSGTGEPRPTGVLLSLRPEEG